MGINYHELSLLKFAKKEKTFSSLGVIGRQENFIDPKNKIIPKNLKHFAKNKYADDLICSILALKNIKSFDISNKDNPSQILNFNNLITEPEKFDAFFDGGSLQHTFNIPVVLKNISNHVKEGGLILHAVSSNNLCGFGFYQFSPEFFINYYSEKNGFRNTRVFVADYDDHKSWYEIDCDSQRAISINTSVRLICLVKTEKNKDCEVNEIFQNSFFEDKVDTKKNSNYKNLLIRFYFKILILFDLISTKINLNRNKNLKKKRILDLII